MTPPIPSADVQTQYAIVFILLFFAGIIAVAFYKMWRELLNWLGKQDIQRETEREKQRAWQADQDKVRDERWQAFLENLQNEWIKQDGNHTSALKELIKKVDELIQDVRTHDTWTRAKEQK
jgi:hypothetical protein